FHVSAFVKFTFYWIVAFCETLEESNYRLQKELLEKQKEIDSLKRKLQEREQTILILEKHVKEARAVQTLMWSRLQQRQIRTSLTTSLSCSTRKLKISAKPCPFSYCPPSPTCFAFTSHRLSPLFRLELLFDMKEPEFDPTAR
ncbi:hypothetical protein XENOCAPTIV_027253, partial [Xenoophorus captivus]